MSTSDHPIDHPEERFAAVCGLFCPGCTLYIASTEEPERLAALARLFGLPEEEMRCHGCRSEVRGPVCRDCKLVECAAGRKVEFCAQCTDYPCGDLKEFQAARPHRAELFEDGQRIGKVGFGRWFRETFEKYACRECGTINSAYDLACRACGNEPGSPYAERHHEIIIKHLAAAHPRRTDR